MQSARQDLQSLTRRVLQGAAPEEAVSVAWPLVCGSVVAERAQAISFEAGVLRVRVPDRGWQSQLEAFSKQYVNKLSKLTGTAITTIRYEIAYRQTGERIAGQQ